MGEVEKMGKIEKTGKDRKKRKKRKGQEGKEKERLKEKNSSLKSIRDLFKQVVHLLNLFCGHRLDDEHLVSTEEQSNEV